MTRDDLQELWRTGDGADRALSSGQLEAMLAERLRRSRREVARRFGVELGVAAALYLGIALWVVPGRGSLPALQVWILVLAVPAVGWILVEMMRFFRQSRRPGWDDDITAAVRRNEAALRRVVMAYQGIVYAYNGAIATVVWLEPGAAALPAAVRLGILLFLLVLSGLTRPYLRWVYGRQLRELRDLRAELADN